MGRKSEAPEDRYPIRRAILVHGGNGCGCPEQGAVPKADLVHDQAVDSRDGRAGKLDITSASPGIGVDDRCEVGQVAAPPRR